MWTELLMAAALARPVVEVTPEGDTLVVEADHRAAVVTLHLALPVGSLSPWWREGDVAAAWHLPLTDPELAERLQDRMDFELGGDAWSTTLSATFLTVDTDHALAAVRDFLCGGEVPRGAIRDWRSAPRPPWDTPQRALSVLVSRLMLDPRDPRRQAAPAPPRRLSRLQKSRAALVSITDRIIGFTGDITVKQAREGTAALLPPPSPTPPDGLAPEVPPEPEPSGGMRTDWMPGGGPGGVVLTRPGLSQDDPDHPALLIALHALAGGLRSRLLVGLRHEAGLIYSLSAEDGVGPIPGLMTVHIPTRASRLAQTSERTAEILQVFAADGITDTERRTALRSLQHHAAPETPEAGLLHAMEAVRHGWSLDHRQDTVQAATELSLDEINTFIAAFFAPDAVTRLRLLPSPGLSSPPN